MEKRGQYGKIGGGGGDKGEIIIIGVPFVLFIRRKLMKAEILTNYISNFTRLVFWEKWGK